MAMKVVNLRHHPYTHYIGRPKNYSESLGLGNPFPITIWRNRIQVIQDYEDHARKNQKLLDLIKALPENAVLGCFCRPELCHGDVIIRLWNELHKK